jgi:hypothetical protein
MAKKTVFKKDFEYGFGVVENGDKFNDAVFERVNEAYRNVIDSSGDLKSWRYGRGGKGFKEAVRKSKAAPSGARTRLINLYREAWDFKYRTLRTSASSHFGSDGRYQKWKRDGKPHHGRAKRYFSPLLLTGALRHRIDEGFRQGGNTYLETPNFMMFGGYSVNIEEWEAALRDKSGHSYAYRLIGKMIKSGILESPDDFFDLLPVHWQRIENAMQFLIENDFAKQIGA